MTPRPCACHPGDNPPRPCSQKFAYSECVKAEVPIAEQIACQKAAIAFLDAGTPNDLLTGLRAVLRTLEERRGFVTWCEGAAITLQRAADILCDLGTEEADEVYAEAYTALNLCPVDIPTPPAGDRDAR